MKDNSLEILKYIEIAKKKHKEGNIYQANEIYKKLINQKIYTYDLLISYGLFNKDINNLKTAKNLFISTIKKYPSKIESYILLAEIFRKENNFNDALKTLQVAKNIEKQNPDVDYNLAILNKTIKSSKKALVSIDAAINKKPENQIYKILKADILIDCFEDEKAQELLLNLKLKKIVFYIFREKF